MPLWVRRLTLLFVVAATLAAFLVFFDAVTTVLLGILAASIVASALSPLVRRLPLPRGVAAALVGLALIGVVAAVLLGVSVKLAGPIEREFSHWSQSKTRIDDLLGRISAWAHLEKPLSSDELVLDVGKFFATDRGSLLLASVRDAVFSIFLWMAFVFIGSIFLLSSPRDALLSPALRALPTVPRRLTRETLDALGSRLRWWAIGTLGGMVVVFSASTIGFAIAGLEFAVPLALLAGLGEVVPTVGPMIAGLIALLFAASQNSGTAIGVAFTFVSVQAIEAYVVLPLIMKGAVKIHPAVTLFSVVLWAKVFGLPGLMLAIPINLTLGTAIECLYVRPRERREAALSPS